MDPSLRALDPDLSSDSEEEFPAPTASATVSSPAVASAERSRPGKKSFFSPPKWTLAEGITSADLSCDLLIVAACLPAVAFVSNSIPHTLSDMCQFSPLGQLDFSARSSGPLSLTLCLVTHRPRVIIARPTGRIATESAGALAAALLSGASSPVRAVSEANPLRVVPKTVLVLSSLPYTAHSAGPVTRLASTASAAGAVAAAAANEAGEGAAEASKAARAVLKPLPLERAPEHAYPPLLYSVLTPTALSALAAGSAPEGAATSVPFLPPSSPLFGFDAALIAEATARSLPLCALISIDNPHHYPGETLLAFERGASLAIATAVAAAGPGMRRVVRDTLSPNPIAFSPCGAIGAKIPNEAARIRMYWKWRKETEAAAPAIALAERDVAQHKYSKFAEKSIPHGIFA